MNYAAVMVQSGLRLHPRATSATIAPNIVRYLVLVARDVGVSLDAKLRSVGLSPDVLADSHLRVSYRQGRAVIAHALDVLPISDLGLVVGARQPVSSYGVLGLGMMSSATVADAITLGIEYQTLAGAMVEWTTYDARGRHGVRASLPATGPLDPVDVFLLQEAFASVTQFARGVCSPGFTPERVDFSFPADGSIERYREVFGCEVRFDQRHNTWIGDPAWHDRRLPGADEWALRQATELLRAHAERVGDRQELVELVELRLERALPDVIAAREQADNLSMSERTLRRRLAEVGTNYAAIVDGVRQRRVGDLLANPRMTVAEIAMSAGFSDERSLRRAVRRWYGASPAELRPRDGNSG